MNTIIDISVKNKVAVQTNNTVYVCDNSDFVINFDFDQEWDEHEFKTARFVFNGSYVDAVFEGNQCAVPVISDTHQIAVGVYAGNLHTTTPALISAQKSILSGSEAPAEPHPDVYAQMQKLFEEGLVVASECANSAKQSAKEAKDYAEIVEHYGSLSPLWDAVRNKPFGEETVTKVIVDNISSNVTNNFPVNTFTVGEFYNVIWNGTLYSNIECFPDGEWAYLGEEYEYPFFICVDSNSLYVDALDGSESFTVTVFTSETVINKIDPKYLPEVEHTHSWHNLLDRPFYEDAIEIFPERAIAIHETESATTLRPTIELSENKNHIVVLDGIEYSCISFKIDKFGAEDTVFLGNPLYFGGEDNGMPFIIASSVSMDNTMVFADSGTHTLRIMEGSGIIQTIDPKFIPSEVPAVQSASVGQVLAVKSVDANGKPTEWEAVNAAAGGGGLNITDDGNGNVSIGSTGSVSITDDGAGNVTIR